jgi:hypothetical protein
VLITEHFAGRHQCRNGALSNGVDPEPFEVLDWCELESFRTLNAREVLVVGPDAIRHPRDHGTGVVGDDLESGVPLHRLTEDQSCHCQRGLVRPSEDEEESVTGPPFPG